MLGNQIKLLRSARNISQVALAKELGVTKQTVSNWENNNILPSVEMLRKLALHFSCSADYLLELDNDERVLIEFTGLTITQTAHIQQIIADLSEKNSTTKVPPKR